jgi:hypothetical protein
MPVIHVRGLRPDGGTEQADAALRLIAREVAAALGEEPRSTWCTFTAVTRMSLGERIVEQADRIVYLDMWIRPRDPAVRRQALEAACRPLLAGWTYPSRTCGRPCTWWRPAMSLRAGRSSASEGGERRPVPGRRGAEMRSSRPCADPFAG